MRLLMNTLVQQAQYDLAHVHADRIKLKRLELALLADSGADIPAVVRAATIEMD